VGSVPDHGSVVIGGSPPDRPNDLFVGVVSITLPFTPLVLLAISGLARDRRWYAAGIKVGCSPFSGTPLQAHPG
jgi:hypothetical protein